MENTITLADENGLKALVVSWLDLYNALFDLHKGAKVYVDQLHDIWKFGAPSPDSIIRDPRHYDERLRQRGNVEKRVVFPTPLARWIEQTSAAWGHPYTHRQAMNMLYGVPDYGLDIV